MPDALRVVFEDDLVDVDVRKGMVGRVARFLDVPAWAPPPEHETPSHEALWNRVIEPERLAAEMRVLERATGEHVLCP
ncbi:MAG: hypothetical protein ACRD0G_10570 [Acidimicrobiales bacterium]